MEQVLEREAVKKYDWRTVHMYDEDGNRITNEMTLRSMAEGMELVEEWERRIERTGMAEAMRRCYEGDDELDGEEEA